MVRFCVSMCMELAQGFSHLMSSLGHKVRVNWKLTAIQKAGGGGYTLTYETPEGTITVGTKALVLTVPSYVASDILQPLSQGAADALSKFYYPPVAAVTISFPLSAIREDRLVGGELKGFGQLHPRSQGVQTLGMAAFLSSF
jgi:oxygen-dependent protoporphyrinogen oxidase